ncbi:hypothetical protein [Fusobacterium varium]|uniref:hypothetical protein n=1 Tax=Fusobacterium varium TaxID=856 RepID=UPI003F10059C
MNKKRELREILRDYSEKEALEAYLDFLGVDYSGLKEKAKEKIFSRYGYRVINNKEIITPYIEEHVLGEVVGYIKTILRKDNEWIVKDIMASFDYKTDCGWELVEEYRKNLDPQLKENEIKIKKLQRFLETWS